MAWEQKQKIYIVNTTETNAKQLANLMWEYPQGRFLPHVMAAEQDAGKAPVNIGTLSSLKPTDVVINLCPEAIPQPDRFSRVLEIVPFANDEREASRAKFKTYRNQGITPRTHEINK